jgi:5-methyltetrahydrofolate--homocysteine methyltransferase
MTRILEKLKASKVLSSDGAWGTLLQAKGLKSGECPESWNLDHPDAVMEIASLYIKAGADMIETNSFGGNLFKLKHYGLEHKVREINQRAAELSRMAAGKEKIVLGSMGPTGKILMMGDVSEKELYEAFKEQCRALADGGADAIVVETMSDLDEARIAVKAAHENTSCEIICTMTFERTVSGEYRTMMGVSPTEMIPVMIEAGADIIGANCGNGIRGMVDIVREIRTINPDIPVLIHANAGLPRYEDGKTVFPETPEEMASFVPSLVGAGATIIGGCCGTTPDHIRLICRALDM